MGPRIILHADMDAFYASVEQRDRPELRGQPVVVGGGGPRGVVATASYEARQFGVRSAMPGAEARRRCPDAVFVAPRMEVYAAVSQQVRDAFERFTPLIEPLSLDEAFLDVTGSVELFGNGAAIAQQLRADVREATGLAISVGVASSKYVAKVASDLAKPDGWLAVGAAVGGPDVQEFLRPLPVSRLWGAGPKTEQRLHRCGWRTIGDLQQVTQQQLVDAIGESAGMRFFELARGIDLRTVEADRDVKSVSHETTFPEDLVDRDALRGVLLELAEMVGRRLRRQQLAGRTVRLKVRFADFSTPTRQRRLDRATTDERILYAVGAKMLDAVWDGVRGIRLLGLGVADLHARGAARPQQGQLFGQDGAALQDRAQRDGSQRDEAAVDGAQQDGAQADGTPADSSPLLDAVDRIRDRFGEGAIRRGSTLPRREP